MKGEFNLERSDHASKAEEAQDVFETNYTAASPQFQVRHQLLDDVKLSRLDASSAEFVTFSAGSSVQESPVETCASAPPKSPDSPLARAEISASPSLSPLSRPMEAIESDASGITKSPLSPASNVGQEKCESSPVSQTTSLLMKSPSSPIESSQQMAAETVKSPSVTIPETQLWQMEGEKEAKPSLSPLLKANEEDIFESKQSATFECAEKSPLSVETSTSAISSPSPCDKEIAVSIQSVLLDKAPKSPLFVETTCAPTMSTQSPAKESGMAPKSNASPIVKVQSLESSPSNLVSSPNKAGEAIEQISKSPSIETIEQSPKWNQSLLSKVEDVIVVASSFVQHEDQVNSSSISPITKAEDKNEGIQSTSLSPLENEDKTEESPKLSPVMKEERVQEFAERSSLKTEEALDTPKSPLSPLAKAGEIQQASPISSLSPASKLEEMQESPKSPLSPLNNVETAQEGTPKSSLSPLVKSDEKQQMPTSPLSPLVKVDTQETGKSPLSPLAREDTPQGSPKSPLSPLVKEDAQEEAPKSSLSPLVKSDKKQQTPTSPLSPIATADTTQATTKSPLSPLVKEETQGSPKAPLSPLVKEETQKTPASPLSPLITAEVAETTQATPKSSLSPLVKEETQESPKAPLSPLVKEETQNTLASPLSPLIAAEATQASPKSPLSPLVKEETQGSPKAPLSPLVKEEAQKTPASPLSPLITAEATQASPKSPLSPLVKEETQGSPKAPLSPLVKEEAQKTTASPLSPLITEETTQASPKSSLSPLVKEETREESILKSPISPLAKAQEKEDTQKSPLSPLIRAESTQGTPTSPLSPLVKSEATFQEAPKSSLSPLAKKEETQATPKSPLSPSIKDETLQLGSPKSSLSPLVKDETPEGTPKSSLSPMAKTETIAEQSWQSSSFMAGEQASQPDQSLVCTVEEVAKATNALTLQATPKSCLSPPTNEKESLQGSVKSPSSPLCKETTCQDIHATLSPTAKSHDALQLSKSTSETSELSSTPTWGQSLLAKVEDVIEATKSTLFDEPVELHSPSITEETSSSTYVSQFEQASKSPLFVETKSTTATPISSISPLAKSVEMTRSDSLKSPFSPPKVETISSGDNVQSPKYNPFLDDVQDISQVSQLKKSEQVIDNSAAFKLPKSLFGQVEETVESVTSFLSSPSPASEKISAVASPALLQSDPFSPGPKDSFGVMTSPPSGFDDSDRKEDFERGPKTTTYFDGYLLQYQNTPALRKSSESTEEPQSLDSNFSSKTYDKITATWKDNNSDSVFGVSAFSSGPSSVDMSEKDTLRTFISHPSDQDESATSSITSHITERDEKASTTSKEEDRSDSSYIDYIKREFDTRLDFSNEKTENKDAVSGDKVKTPLESSAVLPAASPLKTDSSRDAFEAKEFSNQISSTDNGHVQLKVKDSTCSGFDEHSMTSASDASASQLYKEKETTVSAPTATGLQSIKSVLEKDVSPTPYSEGAEAEDPQSWYKKENQFLQQQQLADSCEDLQDTRYGEAERDWERHQYYHDPASEKKHSTTKTADKKESCADQWQQSQCDPLTDAYYDYQEADRQSDSQYVTQSEFSAAYYGQQYGYDEYQGHLPETADQHVYTGEQQEFGYEYSERYEAYPEHDTSVTSYSEHGDHQNGNAYHYYDDANKNGTKPSDSQARDAIHRTETSTQVPLYSA